MGECNMLDCARSNRRSGLLGKRLVLWICGAYALTGCAGVAFMLSEPALDSGLAKVEWTAYPLHLRCALWVEQASDMWWFCGVALAHLLGTVGAWKALRAETGYRGWLWAFVLSASVLAIVQVAAFATVVAESPVAITGARTPSFIIYTVNVGALLTIAGSNGALVFLVGAMIARVYRVIPGNPGT